MLEYKGKIQATKNHNRKPNRKIEVEVFEGSGMKRLGNVLFD